MVKYGIADNGHRTASFMLKEERRKQRESKVGSDVAYFAWLEGRDKVFVMVHTIICTILSAKRVCAGCCIIAHD